LAVFDQPQGGNISPQADYLNPHPVHMAPQGDFISPQAVFTFQQGDFPARAGRPRSEKQGAER
jgi:hypothetical protein